MVEVAFYYNVAQRRQSPFFNMRSIVERCSMCMQIARFNSKYEGQEVYFCTPECHNRYNLTKARRKNLILIRIDEVVEESEEENEVILVNEKTEPDHSREERLFKICRDNDHQRLHRILEKEFNIDIMDKNGRSLISVAAFYGDTKLLKMLVHCGIDVNFAGDEDSLTALMSAVESDDVQKVEILLAAGADAKAKTKEGRIALHLTASNSEPDCAKALLEADPRTANTQDDYGITPLHLAAGKENYDLIRTLLNWGAASEEDNLGRMPIHWAVVEGSVLCVNEILLSSKTFDLDHRDRMGQTAIHYAIRLNFTDVVKLLIDKGCDLTIKNTRGLTPLLLAACCGNQTTCQSLVAANEKSLHDTDKLGWGVLHYAAARNDDELCDFFIKSGVNVDLRDSRGHTPIFVGSTNGNVKCVKLLIKKGALSLMITDKIGRTPLHYAAEGGHIRVVSLLVAVISMMTIAKKIVERQAWIDRRDDNEHTSLHLAVSRGHADCCQLLIDYNANIDSDDINRLKKLGINLPESQLGPDEFDASFDGINAIPPASFFRPRQTSQVADHTFYVYSAPVVSKKWMKKTKSKKSAWNDCTNVAPPPKKHEMSLDATPRMSVDMSERKAKSRFADTVALAIDVGSVAPTKSPFNTPSRDSKTLNPSKSPFAMSRYFNTSSSPRSNRISPVPPPGKKPNIAATPTGVYATNNSPSTKRPSNKIAPSPQPSSGYGSEANKDSTNNGKSGITNDRQSPVDVSPNSPTMRPRRVASGQMGRITPTDHTSRRNTGTPGIVSLMSTNLAEIHEENETVA